MKPEKHEAMLAEAAHGYRAAQVALEAARKHLAVRVQAARKDGLRQVDIIRATGNVWTREHIRQLTRKT